MKKLEADVKEASRLYKEAEDHEDELEADLARFRKISAGAIPRTPDDAELMAHTEDQLEKLVEKAKKKRRKLQATLDKRIKTRDTATEQKFETIDKKEGQIYYDGIVYTARWSCLPRLVYYCRNFFRKNRHIPCYISKHLPYKGWVAQW